MANYAHIENNIVVNIVVADVEWVESQNNNYVLIDGQSIEIGSSYENGNFVGPQPYPSWTRDGFLWKAPKPIPNDAYSHVTKIGIVYSWEETILDWVIPNL